MSRSGYSDDCDGWSLIMWRGAVKSAIRGKRGQAALRDMLAQMDAMPVKELIAEQLENSKGQVCTLGALGVKRGIDMSPIDYDEPEQVAKSFNLSDAFVREVAYQNDECVWYVETPAQRFDRMRKWVVENITP